MRRKIAVLGGVAVIGAATLLFSACIPLNLLDDCERNPNLQCFWANLPSGTSGGGGDGGTPPACVPSENDEPVEDSCGVFVSSSVGDDDWEGTKAKPLKTIAAGVKMAAAKGGPVYACAEEHAGSVTLTSGVKLYGGLDCASGWAYVGETKRSELAGSADEIALTITKSAGGAEVVDFTIRAPDAKTVGGSSIAVLAEGVTAELVRCELVAGNGAAGAMGAPGDPNGEPAAGGAEGNKGKDACSSQEPHAIVPGGASVFSSCGSDVSIGGNGGSGALTAGTSGADGQFGSAGQGGPGEKASGCGNGGTGSDGIAGMAGASATDLGSISASGYTGTSGGAGTSGKAGQGGGGGGGAKGGKICSSGTAEGPGASGGSGGGGGCGGLPGQGGEPGGASIALVSLKAELTLTDTTLTAAKGGDGGAGGDAQNGGPGGSPGEGGKGVGGGCSGGNGGKGGDGGPGGGGLGGPSLGIAFQGAPPQTHGKTSVTPGTPGAGGPGGSGNVANNQGDAGIASEQQELP